MNVIDVNGYVVLPHNYPPKENPNFIKLDGELNLLKMLKAQFRKGIKMQFPNLTLRKGINASITIKFRITQ